VKNRNVYYHLGINRKTHPPLPKTHEGPMTRQENRQKRYRSLRQAGFTPQEARRLRDSGIRTRAALRAIERSRPLEEARFTANQPRTVLTQQEKQTQAQRAFNQYSRFVPQTDQEQRKLWGRNFKKKKVPESWRKVHRDYEGRLRGMGFAPADAESEAWRLTFNSIMKREMEPETVTETDIMNYLAGRS
jgi:hypothetical protein